MSLFKLPKVLYEEINSILAEYCWGQLRNKKKIHWIKWSSLCEPKAKEGVGFRDLSAFNLVMLAKQAWHLIHRHHSLLYRVYKARYFPTCFFLEANMRSNLSYVW